MGKKTSQLRWLALLGAATTLPAQALTYELGEIDLQVDTTISFGLSLATQNTDPTNVGIANGGEARSVNGDDGNLNFDRGDLISAAARISGDIQADWRNFTFFTRLAFFNDFQNRNTSKIGSRGRERIGRDGDLLDLFIQGRFRVFDRPLTVRVGRQVVSWGESTFIPNGINVINAIDVTRFRSPGSRIQDALLPSPMVWVSMPITNALSFEALYISTFDEIVIDPRGAFFSTNDFASDDGDKAFLGLGRRQDDNSPPNGTPMGPPPDGQLWFSKAKTQKPDGDEQYGVALRYLATGFNSTEFGFFYLNYDSRLPLISAIKGQPLFFTGPNGNVAKLPGTDPNDTTQVEGQFFVEFPENIDLFGLSFNTLGPMGIALQGEYSYRPNLPLQLSATDVILQALDASASTGGNSNINNNVADNRGAFASNGDIVQGWERVDQHQLQITGTQVFGPSFGADQWVVLGEAGATYLDLPKNFEFNGPGAALPVAGSGQGATSNGVPAAAVSNGSLQNDGFVTRFSWGYRVLSRLDYENFIGPWQFSPQIIFAHDVNGVGPSFTDGTKAVILGFSFDYLRTIRFEASYTNFFDGQTFSGVDPAPAPGGQSQRFRTHSNANIDRDFVSVNLSYAF